MRPPRAGAAGRTAGSRAGWKGADCRALLPRTACDSIVALRNATAAGVVLFGKNSDRPACEAQPLCFLPRARHGPGERVRCQYIEIEQVPETAAVIASRPYWLWGFEHGVNEYGVAIGNHTVFAKDPLEGKGLIGMDLVRLGLERSRSARQAADVISALVQAYGQGGSGFADKEWPYHNSFLIADGSEAYLLETSDRWWAWRRVRDVASASNHIAIGTDWDALAPGAVEHAVERGWWPRGGAGRFDFAGAFRDHAVVPAILSSGRHQRAWARLQERKGSLTEADFRALLRDHYESGALYCPRYSADDERYYTICMHAEPVGTTTASAVVRIAPEREVPLGYWACLGSPCASAFLPLYFEAGVPQVLLRGGENADLDSPWWKFREIAARVERSPDRYARCVRAFWDEFEAEIVVGAERAEQEAATRKRRGDSEGAAGVLRAFSFDAVRRALEKADELLAALRA